MVDAIISTVVEDLTSMVLSSIKEEVKLVTGVKDEVKKLLSNFKSVKGVLDDAEERQLKEPSVENWLLNLKAVSYDMDDVIDEWKTWIQTSQFQHQHHSPGSDQNHLKHKVLCIFRCMCFIKHDVGFRHVVARKIREIQQRLDGIATDKDRYQLSSSQKTEKNIERHVTTSFVDIEKVKGRDKEKDEVKSQILKAKSNPHIISLVGLGGIGKTTLAQLVYNDTDIQTHFEKKIWVWVSEPFDEIRIAKAILESLCGSSAHDFKELANVLKEISVFLNERRFLLVLDDVWNENSEKWEALEKLFMCGLPGTTIMITTRNERVAIAMGCNPKDIHKVGSLTSEECWSIISQIALVQGDCQKFESIGRRIADKCKGLPLAATTIGGLLRFKKSEKEWVRVLEKKEWEGEGEGVGILGPLKLIYYDLSLPLKQCFSYCAIFPNDFEIEKRRLIGMWNAQGYLKGKEEDENFEIVGETYFENLVARSLLQISVGKDNIYMLHDMVSDLVRTIAKDECLMIDVRNDREPNRNFLHLYANARHLYLAIELNAPFPVSVYGLNKLRSLIIHSPTLGSLTVVELEGIFDHLTCLTTLNLRDCDIKEVPSLINRLVHLRWLDLSENANLEKLPETLCECYNLQALILNRCWNLVKLPKRIGRLINLIYLDTEGSDEIEYLPKGIGNLRRLRELTVFIISVNESDSCSIVEMEKLNNLRGRLEIRGLGNVRKLEEARKAQLEKKKCVTELSFSFDGDVVQEDEEKLLEALEPPSDLEILSIDKFKGKTVFPSWMMKLNLLRKLTIKYSENCEELPSLGQLLCLEELKLRDMIVKKVGVEFLGIEKENDASTSFPKLKILSFELFWEWEEWDDIDDWLMVRINNKTINVLPCLQELYIYKCKRLKTLPYCLLNTTRLQELNIIDCDVLEQEVQKAKLSYRTYLRIRRVHGGPCHQRRNVKNVRSASNRVELEKEKTKTLDNLRDVEMVEPMPNVDE